MNEIKSMIMDLLEKHRNYQPDSLLKDFYLNDGSFFNNHNDSNILIGLCKNITLPYSHSNTEFQGTNWWGDFVDNHTQEIKNNWDKFTFFNKFVQFVIKNGAHLNAKDDEGNTALNLATQSGNTEIVNLLLKSGANPFFMNNEGKTAFDYNPSLVHAIHHYSSNPSDYDIYKKNLNLKELKFLTQYQELLSNPYNAQGELSFGLHYSQSTSNKPTLLERLQNLIPEPDFNIDNYLKNLKKSVTLPPEKTFTVDENIMVSQLSKYYNTQIGSALNKSTLKNKF